MNQAQAERAVALIIKDLTDRRGLRQMWEEIDRDIQDEIRAQWAAIILSEPAPESPNKEGGK